MKHLLLLLSLAAGCTAAAQKRPATGGLSALQDSIWQWAADNKATDPVANAIYASAVNEPDGVIDVHMIRADTAMKARFRRRVHDSPLIRLHGFDPDTTPYPPAPEGAAPPDGLPMEAKYAFYPACTEHIRLTIRHKGDSTVYFGSDYTVCRFQHGRWETLPVVNAWNSLLTGIGPNNLSRTEVPHPAPAAEYTYGFTARLAPRVYPARYARYRICKQVYKTCPYRPYLLTAEFTVTPFVPFTRFAEPAEGQDIQF